MSFHTTSPYRRFGRFQTGIFDHNKPFTRFSRKDSLVPQLWQSVQLGTLLPFSLPSNNSPISASTSD
ncbi:19811_t:CDS:2 [Gigaspora margarita]|uniref:19811_t:CDS:1 n=1 Tax=Gigaspora margarita TaxID=4874 RepID=A0ABN7VIL7_GIGMA|nr:19811_t:CDS:2 [Gigaspora margarita]